MKPTNASLTLFNILVFQIFALFLLSLAGCTSKDLSRSTAESQITEANDFKSPYQIEYTQGSIKFNEGLLMVISEDETKEEATQRKIKNYMELTPQVAVLYHHGLVEPKVTSRDARAPGKVYQNNPVFWRFIERYVGTEKADKYWQQTGFQSTRETFPVAQREFIEVTGITKQGETQAMVEFTWRWKPNEIGKALDSSTSEFKSLPVELQQLLSGEKIPEGAERGTDWRIDWKEEKQGRAFFQKYDDGWRLIKIFSL